MIQSGQQSPEPYGLPQGERKIVTVLFADVVNSSALVDGTDPEAANNTPATISKQIGARPTARARRLGRSQTSRRTPRTPTFKPRLSNHNTSRLPRRQTAQCNKNRAARLRLSRWCGGKSAAA